MSSQWIPLQYTEVLEPVGLVRPWPNHYWHNKSHYPKLWGYISLVIKSSNAYSTYISHELCFIHKYSKQHLANRNGNTISTKAPPSHSQTEAINRSASKKQVINRSGSVIISVVSLLYYTTTAYQ